MAPDAILKRSPSIKDLIHDTAPKPTENNTPKGKEVEATEPSKTESVTTSIAETITADDINAQAVPNDEPVAPNESQPQVENPTEIPSKGPANDTPNKTAPITTGTPQTIEASPTPENSNIIQESSQPASTTELPRPNEPSADQQKLFMDAWNKMIDIVFAEIPTVYSSLKEIKPTKSNDIINLCLKNDLQIEDFNIKKIEALRILREFDNTINDIVITLDTQHNIKKYIIDDADKVEELRKQNADFDDFLKVLDLSIKN